MALKTPHGDVLASGPDGHRHLVGFRGGQKKHHVGRGFFQGFKEGVEGGLRQHVHFVHDINLKFTRKWGQAHVALKLSDFVDTSV
jgi:hypothetical protein